MKKLIIILSFLLSYVVTFAQFPNSHTNSNASTLEIFRGGIRADSGIVVAYFTDTTQANKGWLKRVPDIYISVADTLFKRNHAATAWVKQGGSDPSAGLNFANADLTATGNRTHNFSGYYLWIDSLRQGATDGFRVITKTNNGSTGGRASSSILLNSSSVNIGTNNTLSRLPQPFPSLLSYGYQFRSTRDSAYMVGYGASNKSTILVDTNYARTRILGTDYTNLSVNNLTNNSYSLSRGNTELLKRYEDTSKFVYDGDSSIFNRHSAFRVFNNRSGRFQLTDCGVSGYWFDNSLSRVGSLSTQYNYSQILNSNGPQTTIFHVDSAKVTIDASDSINIVHGTELTEDTSYTVMVKDPVSGRLYERYSSSFGGITGGNTLEDVIQNGPIATSTPDFNGGANYTDGIYTSDTSSQVWARNVAFYPPSAPHLSVYLGAPRSVTGSYRISFLPPNDGNVTLPNLGFPISGDSVFTVLSTKGSSTGQVLKWDNSNKIWRPGTDSSQYGVTRITAAYGINGGTVTDTGTFSVDTANSISTKAYRDKGVDTIVNKIIYPKQSILNASIIGFGDSFTNPGMNASPSDSSYINKIKTYTGGTLSNQASGGRGVWIMEFNAYANVPLGNTKIITALSGLNDYRRSGYNTKTNNKVYNSYVALFVSQFATKFVNGCNPEIVKSAGWTGAYQGQAVGLKYGPATSPSIPNTTHGIFNGTPLSGTNDSLQWTFSGDNVVCAFAGVDNVTYTGYGTFEIYVDNVLKTSGDCKNQWDGISDGTYDNGRGAYVIPIFGLSTGTHTVKVKIFGNGYVPFDYFAVLGDPKLQYPVYVGDIPHLDATGYATAPANANDAIVDSGSRVIRSAVNLFRTYNYPVYSVTTNVYYILASGLDPADHIHPNNTGHRQIYNAFKAVLDSNSTITTSAFDNTPVSHSGWQGYSGTPTISGGTPPSGTASHVYRWSRKDDLVTLIIQLNFSVAGVSNTSFLVPLPSDCPTPSFPVASQVVSTYVNVGAAAMRTGGTASATILQAGLRLNSGGTGYEIQTTTGSATGAKIFTVQIQYWTGQ